VKDKQPKFEPYGERCFQLVEAFPQSPSAMRALVFVIAITRDTPQAARAVDLLKPRVAEADLEYLSKHLNWWFPYGMTELAPLVFAKVKAKPEDRWAPTVVVWVCLAAAQGHSEDSGKLFHEAVEYLVRHHGGSSYLWSVLHRVDLAKEPDIAWAEQQLRAILTAKSIDTVRRLAAYTLAALLARQSEASQPEAEKWLRECLRICQEMKATGANHKIDLTEAMAQQLLAKIQRFGLGRAAPEIAGQDLDGQAFKLSDYRGKVVLLDFWGFW
jgi:AhpC/TSA family